MELNTVSFGSEVFTANNTEKNMVTEISTLAHYNAGRRILDAIHDDAAVAGFTIISEKTGTKAVFYLDKEEHDADGDVTAWYLYPTSETLCRLPQLTGWAVVVLND